MDIKLSKIFGTIWCVLVFSTTQSANLCFKYCCFVLKEAQWETRLRTTRTADSFLHLTVGSVGSETQKFFTDQKSIILLSQNQI